MIEVVKAKDERRAHVLRRKRTYEEKTEGDGVKFFRDPNQAPKKRLRDEAADEDANKPKPKKTKAARAREKKKAAKLEAGKQAQDKSAVVAHEKRALSNPSVRIHNYPGLSSKTIVDILDPDILKRTSRQGNPYHLPFQNCTYKSKIQVVDFFPHEIADFAAPRMISQYDELSDNESSNADSDDGADINLSPANGGEEIQWEWRFFLLVEDARPQPGCQDRPTQMELLVADTDGDCLFNMDACDLRDRKNEQMLAQLREKLFHLWGDLQEKKDECRSATQASKVKPSARPFECLIKEYGVPARSSKGGSDNTVTYERLFRLFGTAI